jgi:hypothetical protein
MADGQSYYEMLKHPKWQKKRLEILQRDGFSCEDCGADDVTLHVHHAYYEKGLAPWDYPDESLHSLCESCHQRAQNLNTVLQRQIGKLSLGADVAELIGYTRAIEAAGDHTVVVDVFSYEVACGVGDYFGLSAMEVIEALEEGQIDGHKLFELTRAKSRYLLALRGGMDGEKSWSCGICGLAVEELEVIPVLKHGSRVDALKLHVQDIHGVGPEDFSDHPRKRAGASEWRLPNGQVWLRRMIS